LSERRARAGFSGNAHVPVGSYVNADEDVGVPGKRRRPEEGRDETDNLPGQE